MPGPDTGRPAVTKRPDTSDTVSGAREKPVEPEPEHGGRDADQGGHPAPRPRPVTHPADPAKRPDTNSGPSPKAGPTDPPDAEPRKSAPVTDEQLLAIARQAVTEAGDLTRKVVADAIRGHGHGLGNDRLTVLMQHLRKEADKAPDTLTG